MTGLQEIVDYKKSLGYSSEGNYILLAQTNDWSGLGWGLIVAALANSTYFISFERNGLLFMHVNTLAKLTKNDKLIPYDRILKLEFRKTKNRIFSGNGHSSLNQVDLYMYGNDGSVNVLSAWKYAMGYPWLGANLGKVKELVDSGKYESFFEEKPSVKMDNQATMQQKKMGAAYKFCSHCGAQISSEQRYCSSCGKKV